MASNTLWMQNARERQGVGPEHSHGSMMADGDAHWMEKAFNPAHKGRLHRALHVPEGKTIPAGKLAAAQHAGSGHVRQMANAAANARPYRAR